MPEHAYSPDLLKRHRRRLLVLLRALLPTGSDAESAWREALMRMAQSRTRVPDGEFASWMDGIARTVAAEHRKTLGQLPFSDDLFRQLADSAQRSVDIAERRPKVLTGILDRLPPPELDLLRRRYALRLGTDQIAIAEGRPKAAIVRDLTVLHASLVSAVQESLPDGGPSSPGGASDLGRLVDQLLDGTISDDGRLVLETLLLADAPAQAHYHRHVALAVDLAWKYRGEPEIPGTPKPGRQAMTAREWFLTIGFVVACLAAAAFIVLLFTGRLPKIG